MHYRRRWFASNIPGSSSQPPDPSVSVPSVPNSIPNTPVSLSGTPSLPPPPPPPKKSLWLRISLLILIFVAWLVNSPPLDFWKICLALGSVLSVSILGPLDEKIDDFGTWVAQRSSKILRRPLSWIWRLMKRPFSWMWQHRRAISVIFIVLILLLTPTHQAISSFWNQGIESLCLNTSWSLWCADGIGTQTFYTADREPLTVGLLTYQQQGPFEYPDFNQAEVQVERKIFTEDQKACVAKDHITLAVATMLSKTVEDVSLSSQVGLEDLHGAALAQQQYNHPNPKAQKASPYQLCLVIVNLGARTTPHDVLMQVLKQIVLYAKHDPSFRGVVGFPLSTPTLTSLGILQGWSQADFPIVSPSVTSDDKRLDNAPDFYSVSATNQTQADAMLQFIMQVFQTRTRQTPVQMAIFRDDNDVYSQSLATDMQRSIDSTTSANSPANILYQSYPYTVGNGASLQKPVEDALGKQQADLLYFAGYSYDLQSLQEQIQAVQIRLHLSKHVVILGGDGLYNTAAQQTRPPSSLVFATVYASPLSPTDPYVQAYTSAFGPLAMQGNLSLLPPHAILSFDAVSAFTYTLEDLAKQRLDATQSEINQYIGNVSFTGLSGTVTFQRATSNTESSMPLGRHVYILCTDAQETLHIAANLAPGTSFQMQLLNPTSCS